MHISTLMARIILTASVLFGFVSLVSYVWRESSGFRANILGAFLPRGNLGDMALIIFVYPLIIALILAIVWMFHGVQLGGLTTFLFFLLIGLMIYLSAILLF